MGRIFKSGLFLFLPIKNFFTMNPPGVTVRPSPYSVKETIDRLEDFLRKQGVTIYARINQQSELNKTGQTISPLEFLMFGNPKAGGALMTENPLSALDLPLKIIAWEDKQNKVWLGYNDAAYIRERYSLSPAISGPLNLDPLIAKVFQ
ncbi:MAG TPA: DUF302 domain-containing protein [Puia sp.]|nr:DUF302 domain-containing protein [Puia sp.]